MHTRVVALYMLLYTPCYSQSNSIPVHSPLSTPTGQQDLL
jgi:hypothetical protein